MKKYITTLAVMAFAIAGCTKGPELTGDTTGKDAGPDISEEDMNKAEEAGPTGTEADATDPSNPANKK